MESLQTPAAAEGDVVDVVAPAASKNRRGRLGRRLDVGLSTLLLLGDGSSPFEAVGLGSGQWDS